MNKSEFIEKLRARLGGLPSADLEDRLDFYRESIDDRIEEGLSEEEAVAGIGDVDEIAEQILSELPLARLVKEKIKPKRRLRSREILLLALGSPIWLSLGISAVATLIALYASFWAVVISFWSIFVSFVASAAACGAAGIAVAVCGEAVTGVALFGAAMILGGLSIFTFFGCREITRLAILLAGKTVLAIKKCFIKKEDA